MISICSHVRLPKNRSVSPLIISLILLSLALCRPVNASQVELSWNVADTTSAAGYKLYYGTSSGKYTEGINVGNCNTWSMSGLEENKTYYFAATVYDESGTESDFSNEVSKFIPLLANDTEGCVSETYGFDADAEGFVYADDLFRETAHPGYASGSYDGGEGLSVTLGGIDSSRIVDGRSGGWTRSFEVVEAGPVTIQVRYRLTIAGEYESDEYSQVMISVDGRALGTDGRDFVLEMRGTDVNTPMQDSGWRQATVQTVLSRGVHTLCLGVWNNKKTGALETTRAYFDDLRIESENILIPDVPSIDQVVYRINAGGSAVTIDGTMWAADRYFSGNQKAYYTAASIEGTNQDALYQTERYGDRFRYSLPVEPGLYRLKLHFAEIYFSQEGERIFNVAVENGQHRIEGVDIVSEAGPNSALVKIVDNITVNDGSLDVDFEAIVNNGKLSAMEVIMISAGI